MTRKQLPKAITRTGVDLREFATAAVIDEPAPEISSPPAANDQFPAASIRDEPQAAKRRQQARKIVDRHRNYAAMGGLLPLPIFSIAGVTAINMRMVKALSDLYGVPFQRDRTRSAIIGLMGGAVPTGLGAATASTLYFAVPAAALVGLAVSAVSAGALTRGIGLVFIDSFESGTMPPSTAEPKHA